MSGPSFLQSAARPRSVVRLGLLLVAAHVALRAHGLLGSGFSGADLGLLAAARRGDGTALLGEPVGGRLDPLTRLAAQLVADQHPVAWSTAVAPVLVLEAAAGLACLGALVACFGRRPAVLGLLALHVTTAAAWPAAATWSSALPQLAAQAATYAAVGCWVLHLRTHRRRWLAATVAASALGALVAVEALLLPLLLAALAVTVHGIGSVDRRVATLWRVRRGAVLALAAVLVGGALLHRAELTVATTAAPAADGAAAFLRSVVVTAWGGPWHWSSASPGEPVTATPPVAAVVGAVLATAALVAGSFVVRRGVLGPWLLLAGWLAGASALLVLTATDAAAVEQQARALAPAAAVLVLVLGHVLLTPLDAAWGSLVRRSTGPALSPRVSAAAGLVALAVAAGGLLSGQLYAGQRAADPAVDVARTAQREAASYAVVALADAPLPAWFGGSRTPADVTTATLLELVATNVRTPTSSARLLVLDATGRLEPAEVRGLGSWIGPDAGCGWSTTGTPVRVPLENGAAGSWLLVSYLSGENARLEVRVGDVTRVVDVRAGLHEVYVRATDARGEGGVAANAVDLRRSDGGTQPVCVDAVRLGDAVPADPS